VKVHSLNPLDASWVQVESRDTPMHIAALMPFSLPEDAPSDFLTRMREDMRAHHDFVPPWNLRLRPIGIGHLLPTWVEEEVIDLEFHVRHLALPHPGGERELGQLIARLHSQSLDMSRPPWELHLIEGMQGARFALYIKIHHSLLDGISGVRMLMGSMSDDPIKSRSLPPSFWSPGVQKRRNPVKASPPLSLEGALRDVVGSVGGQLRTVPQLALAFASMLSSTRDPDDALVVPFDAPKSSLNGRIRGQRRVATQQFSLARLKALGKAAGCTLNDIVLALVGGALRRFLQDDVLLPEKSLTAGVPVSVRPADDQGAGNAITFIIATMGTDIADPLERLAAITASTQRAKFHVQGLPRDAMTQYTMLLMAPSIISMLTPLGGRTRPMFNVTVSNVPGPDRPLFFRGARLEAIYPISLIAHGLALNVTCQSYADTFNFAFVGCRDTLPHLQKLAVYTADALAELEGAVAAAPPVTAKAAKKRTRRPAKKPVRRAKAAAGKAAAPVKRSAAMRRKNGPKKD
jgi:diacylglycerol O-acyltransferase